MLKFIIPAAVAAISFITWLAGSNNVETPAGCVGFITQGSIMGKTEFVGTQTGPTSSGRHWLYKVVNISVTPYNEDEIWKQGGDIILAKDKLPLLVDAHLIWRIKSDRIGAFMTEFGGLAGESHEADVIEKEAYKNVIRSAFRNLVRDELAKHAGLEINEHLGEISKDIHDQCVARFKDTPFEIINAFIGNCAPPSMVTDEIARKVAATQELQRKQTELEIAQKQEAIKTAEGKAAAALETETAKGKAQAMAEIKKQLTPEFLTYQAILGFNGANRIYVPLGGNGLPIVGNLDLSDAPNQILPPVSPEKEAALPK